MEDVHAEKREDWAQATKCGLFLMLAMSVTEIRSLSHIRRYPSVNAVSS